MNVIKTGVCNSTVRVESVRAGRWVPPQLLEVKRKTSLLRRDITLGPSGGW